MAASMKSKLPTRSPDKSYSGAFKDETKRGLLYACFFKGKGPIPCETAWRYLAQALRNSKDPVTHRAAVWMLGGYVTRGELSRDRTKDVYAITKKGAALMRAAAKGVDDPEAELLKLLGIPAPSKAKTVSISLPGTAEVVPG